MATLTYKKKLTSYSAVARFHAEAGDAIGEVKREVLDAAGIRTPYAYSPVSYAYKWNGLQVILCETSHRNFEIWVVSADAVAPIGTDDEEFAAQQREAKTLSGEIA